jgi:hypothetical protein
MMALTATATNRVKRDILANLRMNDAICFQQSFNRTNLYYEVRAKRSHDKTLQEMSELMKKDFDGKSGIVYCLSRRDCEIVAEGLEKHGISALPYHAGMEAAQRGAIQEKWIKGAAQVICATIAFGMGIDKPDVRLVCKGGGACVSVWVRHAESEGHSSPCAHHLHHSGSCSTSPCPSPWRATTKNRAARAATESLHTASSSTATVSLRALLPLPLPLVLN